MCRKQQSTVTPVIYAIFPCFKFDLIWKMDAKQTIYANLQLFTSPIYLIPFSFDNFE